MKPKRVAIYTRISTAEQKADLQTDELTEYAAWRKWEIAGVYSDIISGTKDKRPALDRLLADVRQGKVDVVLCWRFDRFARSTSHLLRALEEFNALGVDFVSTKDNIDTSTPTGKLTFTILAAVAELERNTIKERCDAGRKAAKRRGVRFGRPAVEVNVSRIRDLRREGLSLRGIAHKVGVSHETVAKILAQN
jgi:DNA invertase Pin-like site-specific DNA recombinase